MKTEVRFPHAKHVCKLYSIISRPNRPSIGLRSKPRVETTVKPTTPVINLKDLVNKKK